MSNSTVVRSFVCGYARDKGQLGRCTPGDERCNNYCNHDHSTPMADAPATYEIQMLDFGGALAALKLGSRVARLGWNGKGMFLFLVPGSTFKVSRPPLLGIYPEGTEINYHGHIDMKTADGMVVPWLASQTDMLAEDWMVL